MKAVPAPRSVEQRHRATSGPCGSQAPGWNGEPGDCFCQLAAGHDGQHFSDGPYGQTTWGELRREGPTCGPAGVEQR